MEESQNTSLSGLQGDPKNPRTITKLSFEKLKTMLKEFGDLSGVVKNSRTNQLVGGHSRVQAFKQLGADDQIRITQTYDVPTATGTLALGYVLINGEPFTYRVVDWPESKQKAANIAANASSNLADWDNDLLAQTVYELGQLDNGAELLQLTALSDQDLDKLNKMIGLDNSPPETEPKPDEPETLSFSLTPEQRELVEEALGHIKATREMAAEQNSSLNGNALYYMSRDYLDRLHGLTTPEQTSDIPAPVA